MPTSLNCDRKPNLGGWITRLVVFLLLCSGLQARAQSTDFLLTIESLGGGVYEFISTGSFSAVDASFSVNSGVDLLNFFGANNSTFNSGSAQGNLIGGGAGIAYNTWQTDNYLSPGLGNNLNIYNSLVSAPTQNFTTSSPAFTGTETIDFSAAGVPLPSVGSTGNILAGYALDNDSTPIGAWQVVATPEPSVCGLFAIAAAGAGITMLRARNRTKASVPRS